MSSLLFPGRHLLNTAFQSQYLQRLLQIPLDQLPFFDGFQPKSVEPIDQIVFAITSCNQAHSRYNPIPFHVRAIGVDRFARSLEMTFDISYRIIGIPHYRPTPRFAEFVLKEIEEQTEGSLLLTPENCVVLCSTPAVIDMYQELSFGILPAELGSDEPLAAMPVDLIRTMAEKGGSWFSNPELRRKLAAATVDLWQDFPDVPLRVQRLWRDPLLNDEGSLTEDRDYSSYAYGMGNNAIVGLKYDDIKEAMLPGKIVDEGCADGALLSHIVRDFPDSDLIGIEITGEFIARCQERQRAGDFGGTYVHFHQRNITQPIFQDNTIDTTLCNSTVHELYSYGSQEESVADYFLRKYRQTAPGGRLIIRDVVGPSPFEGVTDKSQEIYLWLAQDDGSDQDIFRECPDSHQLMEHLSRLSTYSRFLRFSRDFLADMRNEGKRGMETAVQFREEVVDGERYVCLSYQAAAEFISKKDYVDNWDSEMNEEFAFWDFSEWKNALSAAGFDVVEDPNAPKRGSRVYCNQWIVDNRYQGKARLYWKNDQGQLQPMPFPSTNLVLVGEKPIRN